MKKMLNKITFAIFMLILSTISILNVNAAVIDKGQNQKLILNQTLGIAGSRSVVEVFGTGGGGTVVCTSESTYSRAYTAYPEDGWVFYGWATYFDGVLSEGPNSTIGLGDDWLFSKVGNKEAEFDQYATSIQANFELNVDLQIYAVFKPTVKVTIGANGKKSGADVTAVTYGGSHTVRFVPNNGYEINNITLDLYNNINLSDSDRADYTYRLTNITDKHTIYADFRPIQYKIAFNDNGSTSGNMAMQDFVYGTAEKLTANSFAKIGYTFTGWNTAQDGTGTTYLDEQEVNNLATESGKVITLYAQWEVADLTGTLEIAGEKRITKTLTASLKDTNNAGSLSYKWLRDGVDIPNATMASYVLTEDDVGKTLTVVVTSSEQIGSLSKDITGITDKLKIEYNLTNITTTGSNEATYLTEYTTTILPVSEYKLPESMQVEVNGVLLTSDKYTFDIVTATLKIPAENVTGDIRITVVGVLLEKYTLIVNEVENATISPSGVHEVLENSSIDIEIKADNGYKIKSVKVNGVEQKLPLQNNILVIDTINENITVDVETIKITNNPATGDNILMYVILLTIASIGIFVITKSLNAIKEK